MPRAAIEEGIVPGGDVALIRCIDAVTSLQLKGDERPRRDPRQGHANALLLHRVQRRATPTSWSTRSPGKEAWYNADTDTYGPRQAGVIDRPSVARIALQNAAKHRRPAADDRCLVTEKPKDKDEMPAAAVGMGGWVAWAAWAAWAI